MMQRGALGTSAALRATTGAPERPDNVQAMFEMVIELIGVQRGVALRLAREIDELRPA